MSTSWGAAFRELRIRRRMTQTEVAHDAGLSQSFVSRFENGRDVRLSEFDRLYAALGYRARVAPVPAGALHDGVPIPVSA